jgi:transposase
MRVKDVIMRAMEGQYTWGQAAEILGMSDRSVRRWRLRMERHGYAGLVDMRRGRPSPRRIPVEQIQWILRLYRERYSGFNGRHFHRMLRRHHGVNLSYTFVKQMLQGAGLLKRQRARGRHRRRREPKASLGELLHLDGSSHRWLALGAEEERQTMVTVVDDATSRLLYAQLWPGESVVAIMSALKAICLEHGLPAALYTDRARWAVITSKAGERPDRSKKTQLGRALEALGIEHVVAFSPQARGRGERVHRTLQDRLVNELRVTGVRTLSAANAYLRETFLPDHNEQFSRPPRDAESAFVAAEVDLDQFFCHEEVRVIGRDNVLTLDRLALQIAKQSGRRSCAGLAVTVRRHLDGTHSVWRGKRLLGRYDAMGGVLGPVEAAGPVDAGNGPGAHKDLGRRPNGRRRPQLPQVTAPGP